jgi:hypothetical protein
MEGSMSESTFGSEPGESRVGTDAGFDEGESSYSGDVRAGYEDDKPPARVVGETSEDEVDSAEADRAAGYDDENLKGDDDTVR